LLRALLLQLAPAVLSTAQQHCSREGRLLLELPADGEVGIEQAALFQISSSVRSLLEAEEPKMTDGGQLLRAAYMSLRACWRCLLSEKWSYT
jgi:hypothetical protein